MRAVDPEDCSEHGQKQHRNTRKQGTDHRFVLYWYHSLAEDASSFIQITEVNTLQSLYSSLSNSSDRKSNPVNLWDAPRVLAVQHLKNLFLSIFSFFVLSKSPFQFPSARFNIFNSQNVLYFIYPAS